MRIVHYLNQFFGGVGGEERADISPQVREGALGPGRLLEQLLPGAQVVSTVVAGDNYAAERLDELKAAVLAQVRDAGAELFVAGPCFEAGRYGVAAGALCAAVQAELGIPAVTAMARENPGVDLYRQALHIVDSGTNAAAMREVVQKMLAVAQKLARHEALGKPAEEGYIPRGVLRDEFVEETAAQRLVKMLYAKTVGEPHESEFTAASFPPIPAPAPVADLSRATVAIVTDGGLVPRGNPDKIAPSAATNWGAYDITGLSDLRGQDYEVSHRGYDTRYVEQDPDRLVPVDALRELEKEGVVGKVYQRFISTSGLANPLANSRRLGREIAQKLKEEKVDAVILVSA
ncbi:MAG: glycine/betaine/sarcosine/D-proline family reductase selenoprotein B [Chloroflexi bacterium]|nr:glycine/betaine/sarcosine/D-proline family reductase selenoprotein B [Chloroflexota bacterium]